MKSRILMALTALPRALTLASCEQNSVYGRANFVTMSESQEVRIGRQKDVKVREDYGVYGATAPPLINATIASFHGMTETGRNPVRPLTLRIINAPQGTTFAEVARGSSPGKNAIAHLRLLNGLYPNGEPAAGQPLKIIE